MTTDLQKKETTDPAKQADNPIREFFAGEFVEKKFRDIMGNKAPGFITSVLAVVAGSDSLRTCVPKSIFTAAATAAAMDLPINQNLGFAWIIGYGGQAQFQMGYKGYVQLAMRTGQYLKLNVIPVYESQFESWNELTEELKADFSKPGTGPVVGYCGYFKMLNGFEKTVFWTTEKVKRHAEKYSKNKRNDSLWKTDFESMALKTVLKNMLAKWGILSIELQRAIVVDQAVIREVDGDVYYPDNEYTDEEKQKEKAKNSTDETLNLMDSKRKNS